MEPKYHNSHFLLILVVLWVTITAVNALGSIVLPREFFAFREWEVATNDKPGGPFRPNYVFDKTIFGDLANALKISEFRHYRHQRFSTDAFGFRNSVRPTVASYPVVVTGDSDMAGSSLSDEDTFSFQLGKHLSVPVYNYAPMSLLALLADKRFQAAPPKIILWEALEQTIVAENYSSLATIPEKAKIAIDLSEEPPLPRKPKPRLTDYLARSVLYEFLWRAAHYHSPTVGFIDPNTGMLFSHEAMDVLKLDPQQRGIDTVIKGIDRANRLCAARGITLIYMPLPNKEHICRGLLPPNEQGGSGGDEFLDLLHAELDRRGILNVKLYDEFQRLADQPAPPYFLDDTHWNQQGVLKAVELSAKLIADKNLLHNEDKLPEQE